jgi:radical SAM superfamily enzyme YgiQ (UPF0313 family)
MATNILFISLPTLPLTHVANVLNNKSDQVNTLAFPLGILYLSSYLKQHHALGNVSLLDLQLELERAAGQYATVEDFALGVTQKMVEVIPDIVAISLMFSSSHQFFGLMVDVVRKLWPHTKIIVGGVHATNTTAFLLNNHAIDLVLRGEGERAFLEIVRGHDAKEPVDIPGVYSRASITHPLVLAEQIHNLDELPFPDWDLLEMKYYLRAQGRRRGLDDSYDKPMAAIMTTRGCPHKCTYCSAHTVHGRTVRYRSEANIISEIEELNQRYGVNLIIPEDDYFTANKKRVLSLLANIKKLNIPGLEIQCSNALNVNSLTHELLDAMMECGTKVINLAVESGCKYVQEHIMKKNVNLDKARELVEYCRGKGLVVRCTTVLGMPGETREHLQETYDYMRDIGTDWCIVQIFIPLVGSDAYNQLIGQGCISDNDVDLWAHAFFQDRNFDTKEMSASDIKDFTTRMNYDINFINNVNLKERKFDRAISIFNDIIHLYPFHIFAWYGLAKAWQGKGDAAESDKALKQMRHLIDTNEISGAMFTNFGSMLPPDAISLVASPAQA